MNKLTILDSLLYGAASHNANKLYELGEQLYQQQHYHFAIYCLVKAIRHGNVHADCLLETLLNEVEIKKIN